MDTLSEVLQSVLPPHTTTRAAFIYLVHFCSKRAASFQGQSTLTHRAFVCSVRGGMDARKHGARWGGAAEPAVGGGRAIGGEGDGRRAASVGDCGDRKCGVDGGSVGSTTPGSCSKPHGGWPVMDAMDAGGSQDHPSPDLGEPGPAGEHEHPFVTRAERGLVAAAATFAERIAERGVTPRSEVLLRRQGSPSRLSPGGRPTSGEGQWLGKSIRSVQESGVVHHDLGVTGISTTPDQGPGADRPHSPVSTPSRACLEATESVRDEVLWALLGGGTVGVDDVAKSVLERARTTLITRFDSSPATYTAEDAGVRLHVRTGSMAERQEAGPIVIQTDERLLVECGGCSFLVSAVVDCQPSGSTFDVPLDLDFLVEEGQDEESDDSEDASPDGVFNQYKEIIQNTYKVRCLANVFGFIPVRCSASKPTRW